MGKSREDIKEKAEENGESINDIRRKIQESLKDKGKCSFARLKDFKKNKNTDSVLLSSFFPPEKNRK